MAVYGVDVKIHTGPEAIRAGLVKQLSTPVYWAATVRTMIAAGATPIIECGPGKVLTSLNRRVDKNRDLKMLALEDPRIDERCARRGGSPMLSGEIALVTGASRGIGAAIAERLSAEGARVIGTATTAEGAQRIGARLSARAADAAPSLMSPARIRSMQCSRTSRPTRGR